MQTGFHAHSDKINGTTQPGEGANKQETRATGAVPGREKGLSQLEIEEQQGRTAVWPPTLASYGPLFREFAEDDMFKWRLLSHEFGLRWQSTPIEDRPALVETEPAPISPGWDALVAAWVDYHCYHDGIEPPDWVFKPTRVYHGFWTYIPSDMPGLITAAMVHSPSAFLARGVWVEERDLKVV